MAVVTMLKSKRVPPWLTDGAGLPSGWRGLPRWVVSDRWPGSSGQALACVTAPARWKQLPALRRRRGGLSCLCLLVGVAWGCGLLIRGLRAGVQLVFKLVFDLSPIAKPDLEDTPGLQSSLRVGQLKSEEPSELRDRALQQLEVVRRRRAVRQ